MQIGTLTYHATRKLCQDFRSGQGVGVIRKTLTSIQYIQGLGLFLPLTLCTNHSGKM